jgi:hypothetical protein
MAVRRKEMLELGGFDEELGPGATFPSCEDGDAALRALLAGYAVCETDRTEVVHHGFRTLAEGRDLASRDWSGIGAAYAKPLRAGHWSALTVALYELAVCAALPAIGDLAHLRRPVGSMRSVHFLRGFASGMRVPFDPKLLLYRA